MLITRNISNALRLEMLYCFPTNSIQTAKVKCLARNIFPTIASKSFSTNFSKKSLEALEISYEVSHKEIQPLNFEQFTATRLLSFEAYKEKIESTYRKHNPNAEKILKSIDMQDCYALYCSMQFNGYKHMLTHSNPNSIL